MAQPAPTRAIDPHLLDLLLEQHLGQAVPRYDRLWRYYRNPRDPQTDQPAQAGGLPDRLRHADPGRADRPQRERVIENDIGWRIHAMVDFMFGQPVTVQSDAPDPDRAATLTRFLRSVFQANGGVRFFQDLALLGHVYGFVDVLVRADLATPNPDHQSITLDIIEAPRAVALLDSNDYRQLEAYMLHVRQPSNEVEHAGSFLTRVRNRVMGGSASPRRAYVERTQVWTPQRIEQYCTHRGAFGVQRTLESSSANTLGRIPVVHIQNLPQPLFYEGLSEVEPLIPLQDELNTRLSDRANRVTFQSFKMYLGKGIEQFTERPIGPGQMWSTENIDAAIEEFGGDAHNPSEEAHISEIRDALDKNSGVPPVAAGMVRDKVGNLTSENALRIVMMGLLAKTEKKRVTYGAGLRQLCELILHTADVQGVLPNAPEERAVRLDWPNPLPDPESQRLLNAQRKIDLGVSREQVLNELGYGE